MSCGSESADLSDVQDTQANQRVVECFVEWFAKKTRPDRTGEIRLDQAENQV